MSYDQKRNLSLVTFIVFALLGMICVQILLLRKAFELNERSFRQNVAAALSDVIANLETRETVSEVVGVMVQAHSGSANQKEHEILTAGPDSVFASDSLTVKDLVGSAPRIDVRNGFFTYHLNTPQRVRLRILDQQGQTVKELINAEQPAGKFEWRIDSTAAPGSGYFYNFTTDSATANIAIATDSRHAFVTSSFAGGNREKLVKKVLDELAFVPKKPIVERLQPAVLDSLIKNTLSAKGIETPFAYGVYSSAEDSLRLATPAIYSAALRQSEFTSRLFPHDPFAGEHRLVLHFPEQNLLMLRQTGGLLIASVVFTLFIIFALVYTVIQIVKQQRLAKRLADFINNMTHEFKTPIATIGLATEALSNAAVWNDPDKLQRYGGIIRDENTRMRGQVERILQMAVLEEGDYELNLAPLDVHEILLRAVQNLTLQIEQRQGEIHCDLQAAQHVVNADAVHLANVCHNLLDNANKYSPQAPRIAIATTNDARMLHISVTDYGIGIRKENLPYIFEKYYRVPTGNVHDVKGFGLGLSYVKMIVEAHGGNIAATSEFGKGSTFRVSMPLVKQGSRWTSPVG